jgi:hypothetical protein
LASGFVYGFLIIVLIALMICLRCENSYSFSAFLVLWWNLALEF